MAELTTIPTDYGFADQGFLAEGLAAGGTTCQIAPIYRIENGVRVARGFSTPQAFIFIELAGQYERASYGALSVDSTTKVTTLSDMRRDLSQTDASDFTSQGDGADWPKGARVVVSTDPALFGSYALTGAANTFTADQTIDDGQKLYFGGTNAYVWTDDTGTNLKFKDASNSETTLSTVAASGNDEKLGVDSGATPDYLGATNADGVLRAGDGLSYTDGGDFVTLDVTKLKDASASELTIATGAITATGSAHTVDTESDAASDDLDTISGGADGDYLTIWANNDARTVVVKNGTGNILTANGSDFSINTDNKAITLRYDGTNWKEVARADVTVVSTPEVAILQSTRSTATASSTVSVAHGLSGTPDYVQITMTAALSAVDFPLSSNGTSDGTNHKCTYVCDLNGSTSVSVYNSSSYVIAYVEDDVGGGANLGESQVATVSLDGTNVDLVWTKNGTPTTTTMYIQITAIKF